MEVLNDRHNMLHRQAILLRAASEPLNDGDRQRLKVSLISNRGVENLFEASFVLYRPPKDRVSDSSVQA